MFSLAGTRVKYPRIHLGR